MDLYYNGDMGAKVQARLDEKAETALREIARIEGWTTSEAIRECILEGAERRAAIQRPRLIGAGCFDSRLTDLATRYGERFRPDAGWSQLEQGLQTVNGVSEPP